MDEELKKLLTLSTKSVTGLTDSLKKESVGDFRKRKGVISKFLGGTDMDIQSPEPLSFIKY